MAKQAIYAKLIDGKRYDIGSRIGYISANIDFALDREDMRSQIINLINRKKEEIDNEEN